VKRWKKISTVLLAVVVLSQAPFAWRRYRLRRLHNAIQRLASQRAAAQSPKTFRDIKGVMHVHSFLGGHSTGTLDAIIDAANSNGLDFVIMTEHPATEYDTAATTLNGVYAGTLFVNGNEISAANGDRLLLVPGDTTAAVANTKSTETVIAQQKARGGLAILAYPADFQSWNGNYDGIEVYNLFTNARRINPLVTFFDGLWSYRSYPELMFANFYERPSPALANWDRAIQTSGRRLVATAGSDAHANVGLSWNNSSGNPIARIKLDPYERTFHLVRTHVLLGKDQPLTRESLLAAIAAGHCYLSFDLFADPNGFEFTAQNQSGMKTMGDEIALAGGATLRVTLPIAGRLVLFRDGVSLRDESGVTTKEFAITEAGAYRVEVYLPQLPSPVTNKPWLISNPIYVR